MKSRVYIWIDGGCFDPDNFNATLSTELKGSALSRKKIVDGKVENGGRYWMSEVIEVASEYPEDSLAVLLSKLKGELLKVHQLEDIRIVAELVVEYEDADSPRGFYFSSESIRLLAEVGVALDVDVVRAVQE